MSDQKDCKINFSLSQAPAACGQGQQGINAGRVCYNKWGDRFFYWKTRTWWRIEKLRIQRLFCLIAVSTCRSRKNRPCWHSWWSTRSSLCAIIIMRWELGFIYYYYSTYLWKKNNIDSVIARSIYIGIISEFESWIQVVENWCGFIF